MTDTTETARGADVADFTRTMTIHATPAALREAITTDDGRQRLVDAYRAPGARFAQRQLRRHGRGRTGRRRRLSWSSGTSCPAPLSRTGWGRPSSSPPPPTRPERSSSPSRTAVWAVCPALKAASPGGRTSCPASCRSSRAVPATPGAGDNGRMTAEAADLVLRALADPTRRTMLRLVRNEELAAGQIGEHFPITQQAVSQHLQVLHRAGLVDERRDGNAEAVPPPSRRPRSGAGVAGRAVARCARPSQAHRRTGQEEPLVTPDLVVTTTIEASPEEVFPYLVQPRPPGALAGHLGGRRAPARRDLRHRYGPDPGAGVLRRGRPAAPRGVHVGHPGQRDAAVGLEHGRDRVAARGWDHRRGTDAPGPAGRAAG